MSKKHLAFVTAMALAMSYVGHAALGQSNSRFPATQGSSTIGGSTSRPVTISFGGYCPVCLLEKKAWIKGRPEFTAIHNNKVYQFPDGATRDKFKANPAAYAPAFDGDCIVTYGETKHRIGGNLNYGAFYHGKFYFFTSTGQRDKFKAAPADYAMLAMPAAMDGFCAVCVNKKNEWIKGTDEFVSVYDGKKYLFPGAEQKADFDANPLAYVPALGGDCVVCLKNQGERVPGSVFQAMSHKGRLYLFPDAKIKEMFKADPNAYSDVDLALGGNSPVALAETKTQVPGKPELAVMHNGMVYRFATVEERVKFLAAPGNYEPAE